jgi:hypothetical protein
MADPVTPPTEPQQQQPIDIVRMPNLEHRFQTDNPLGVKVGFAPETSLKVGVSSDNTVKVGFSAESPVNVAPVSVGLTTPVNVGFGKEPANVNMNILAPNGVGVNLLGSKEPVALRFVLGQDIVARSEYAISLSINEKEVFAVSIKGTTTFTSPTSPAVGNQ